MIPPYDIDFWQSVWSQLLDMSYYRKDIKDYLYIGETFSSIWKDDPDFEKVMFEYMWKKYSQLKDENGNYLEPKPVPELKNLTVPRFLFECLGSSIFLKVCFPNCTITWSDS